jgi:hypothetical protein
MTIPNILWKPHQATLAAKAPALVFVHGGVPVEYVIFADEGHGFTKKKNQIEGYRAVLKFLDTHLKGKRPGTAP